MIFVHREILHIIQGALKFPYSLKIPYTARSIMSTAHRFSPASVPDISAKMIQSDN